MSKRQTSERTEREGRTGAKDERPSRRPTLWAGAFWLAIWQLAAIALGSELLLPGPATVLACLVEMVPQPAFWARVGFSLVRIAGGFALGAVCGTVGAFAAARWRVVEELLAPLMALAKSVPVASITVLALIWLRAANLAVLVVLLVVLPIVYENVLQGLRATDGKLEEAARLYHVPPVRRLRFLVMPTLFPYLSTALALGLSTAWKAGVAAEVIGIPAGSLGEAIYDAKVYFDTPELFAVTFAVVLASGACTAALRGVLAWIEPLVCGRAGRAGRIERATTAESPVGHARREECRASLVYRAAIEGVRRRARPQWRHVHDAHRRTDLPHGAVRLGKDNAPAYHRRARDSRRRIRRVRGSMRSQTPPSRRDELPRRPPC